MTMPSVSGPEVEVVEREVEALPGLVEEVCDRPGDLDRLLPAVRERAS